MRDREQAPRAELGIAMEHLAVKVPQATPEQTVAEVRGALAGATYDSIDEIAVLDERRLRGIVPLSRLVAAAGDTRVAEVMDSDPPVLRPGVEEEEAAWALVERGESTIAMVDDGGFKGLVPAHRLLAALLHAHDEDLARLGGYLASTKRARLAAEEPVGRRLLHRLPWLVVGLAGAMASAVIVGAFEAQLERIVLLAFFLPAVVYMADAVGTQTETVMIRGLAVGISIRAVLWRELITGVLIGLVIGAAFFPFALAGWADADVALAVGLALIASCSIATLVAMALPWTLQRLGRDPAFGSGPVATIVQDLLSIVAYLLIAASIAG